MEFQIAKEASKRLNKRTYFANPFFIFRNCYESEGFVFENEKVEGKNPLVVYSDSYLDVSNQIIGTGFDEDIISIESKYVILKKEELGLEFFYSSDDWISIGCGKFADIRKSISKLKKEHEIKILNEYPKEKILKFLEEWTDEKRKKETSEITSYLFEQELKESVENIDLIEHYPHKSIFLEENGELLGFCIIIPYLDNLWVALMQKTKHNIRGLPQYLYHLKAKAIGSGNIFTTGAEAKDEKLKKFKEELRPIEIKKIYVIFIGDKL